MPVQNVPIDIIAYGSDGSIVLLAETKTRFGTSESWASKLRRNMLSHGILPPSRYFLIATPEKIYVWKQEGSSADELPQVTLDAREALGPYFAKFHQDPANIGPGAFELLFLSWLTDLSRTPEGRADLAPSLRPLSESGLLSSLRLAEIEISWAR